MKCAPKKKKCGNDVVSQHRTRMAGFTYLTQQPMAVIMVLRSLQGGISHSETLNENYSTPFINFNLFSVVFDFLSN